MGERRATTLHGDGLLGERLPPSDDAEWNVEEWDGSRWRFVGKAKGDRERDRLLHRDGQ